MIYWGGEKSARVEDPLVNGMTPWAYISVFALASSMQCIAEDYRPCSEHKELIGSCWDLRGRVSYFNGNPSVRIWPVGTKRMLGVRDSDPLLIPPNLKSQLSWNTNTFADLRVCPLTRERPGVMQIVCIASVRNIVSRPR